LALSLYDDVEVGVRPSGLAVEVVAESHGSTDVALDETHLVVRAVRAGFDALGVGQPGLALRCTNRIPHGRGLGSSAAAIVAGLVAARELAGAPADPEWLLRLAAEIEGHPDNVAAAVLGGFTVAWTEPDGARALRVEPDAALRPVVFVPEVRQSTAASRGALPSQLDHADAAWNVGRAALLAVAVGGLGSRAAAPGAGDADGVESVEDGETLRRLLFAATEDRLHQPFRLPTVPGTQNLVARLRARSIAAVLSGSGPTVIALAVGDNAVEVAESAADDGFRRLPLTVDRRGAVVVSGI
jgi:homoserine kinase